LIRLIGPIRPIRPMIRLIRPIIKKNLPACPKLGAQPRACLLRAFAPSRETKTFAPYYRRRDLPRSGKTRRPNLR